MCSYNTHGSTIEHMPMYRRNLNFPELRKWHGWVEDSTQCRPTSSTVRGANQKCQRRVNQGIAMDTGLPDGVKGLGKASHGR